LIKKIKPGVGLFYRSAAWCNHNIKQVAELGAGMNFALFLSQREKIKKSNFDANFAEYFHKKRLFTYIDRRHDRT